MSVDSLYGTIFLHQPTHTNVGTRLRLGKANRNALADITIFMSDADAGLM